MCVRTAFAPSHLTDDFATGDINQSRNSRDHPVAHTSSHSGLVIALTTGGFELNFLEAFTGAQQPKAGQIELAAGGVLFLDCATAA